MEERTKVVIYARVSTSAQDYTRQITELRKYAKKQNFEIVKEFSEKISGGKKVEERTAIKEMLDFVKFNKVDKVLIYECSRLSRRQLDFLSIIEQLTEAGVSLYILQNGLETLLPDGKPNPIYPPRVPLKHYLIQQKKFRRHKLPNPSRRKNRS